MTTYYRPLVQFGSPRTKAGRPIAAGWCWFDHAERMQRGHPSSVVPVSELPPEVLANICAPRAPVAGLEMHMPRLMGILNTTPDSFSDGGKFHQFDAANRHAHQLIEDGADILDIGGESTRPGADFVPQEVEISRTLPVIQALDGQCKAPISIDTRKSEVARAALASGAVIVNDVSALRFDPALSEIVANAGVAVCLMHAQGAPENMQDDPSYDNVLLDVYDHLADRIQVATEAGIARDKIIIDPGIGFGKTPAHNFALISGISLFHGLGCPILLGASRKRFIATLTGAGEGGARQPGSTAIVLAGIAQGVQISRVHDIAQTRQALTMWIGATNLRVQ